MNAPIRPPIADCPLPSIDDLAAALGRARAAHERRPQDHRLYAAMLEAEVAYLTAELARRDRALGRERMRAAEIGKRLVRQQEAGSGPRVSPQASPRTGSAATGTRDMARQSVKPRRRRAAAPGGMPLFDFMGAGA